MDFYKLNEIEDWACIKIVKYYRANSGQKTWTKVLDKIKKDLQIVASSDSTFDARRKRKAQEIIDSWKVEQQVLATGNVVSVDNRRITEKHRQEDQDDKEGTLDERNEIPLTQKKKIKLNIPQVENNNDVRRTDSEDEIIGTDTEQEYNMSKRFTTKNGGANKDAGVLTGPKRTITLECNDDDNSSEMPSLDFKKYKETYSKMEDAKKWTLTTGTIVENALYNFGLRCKHEHLSHSFVLDPNDGTYLNENVFTESELHEIRHFQTKQMPLMPPKLLKYLNSFNLQTASEIRKQVFNPEQMDQDFNKSRDFDRDWIRNTEYESNSLSSNHLELWFLIHVWSFIDKSFNDIEEVEVVSLSSSTRKNCKRTVSAVEDMERKKVGRKGDMIIRKSANEFGCAEAGQRFEGPNGTKLLQERGLKMPKMLKDMFNQLCLSFDQDECKTRKLETIGFLHAGLMATFLRLDSPAGYVCRISRTKSLYIASNVKEFGKIWHGRPGQKIVENMTRLIEQPDSDEEDQLQDLQDACNLTPPPSRKREIVKMPTCSDTPQKPKRVKEIPCDLLGSSTQLKVLGSELRKESIDNDVQDD
ncbi:4250_t:CDS:10 [Gigaspora margarita]|uniref:4250_t:CDS:1 n=1 Tax=Gigaspora margarita TaxID=4874 RepID=A0ABN7WDW9_GIGMA|nr:4250_t:CDS:10 [Gigaspora margarita]